MKYLKTLIFFQALVFSSTLFSAEVKASDIHEVTLICMNTESAFQDYILIGLGIQNNNPEKDIAEKIKSVDAFLKNISSHDLGKENNREFKSMKEKWNKVKSRVTAIPSKDDVLSLKKDIDDFILKCERLDENLASTMHSRSAEDAVLISELGIDIQRLTSMYLIKSWGVNLKGYKAEAKDILALYDKTYSKLMSEKDSVIPKKIKEILNLINNDFLLFKIMAITESKRYVPSLAQKKSEQIQKNIMLALTLEEELIP